jgi:hypothetical protein
MRLLLLGLLLISSFTLSAQSIKTDTSVMYSIDGIVKEVLNVVSGEQGKKRDWEQFRNLFLPTAQFAVLYHKDDGTKLINTLTLEEFVRMAGQAYQNDGFLEYEISKHVDEYNGIAQVFQSYYAKELGVEEKGINSFQLVHDGKRWWIFNILWTNDRNGVKVPEKYLKN